MVSLPPTDGATDACAAACRAATCRLRSTRSRSSCALMRCAPNTINQQQQPPRATSAGTGQTPSSFTHLHQPAALLQASLMQPVFFADSG